MTRSAVALGLLVAVFAFASPDGAQAQSRVPPWCAYMGGHFGFDCSFYTFEQCMETARGLGNYCVRNSYAPVAIPPTRRARRARHR